MVKIEYFINAIRSMGLQAIMQAKQGHPGMVISAAPINYAIFTVGMNITEKNPKWINRDRYVLSAGHGSMSLYPILHFSRLVDISRIINFRQKISGLSGHPENTGCEYIDASTGPLGQGIANAVGMAIAETYLENKYKELEGLIDHFTFCVVGDGDLQEGISYEAMSLAGKLKLNKLIVFHDSNGYQLETDVATVNSENLKQRLESMHWNYISSSNDPYNVIKLIKQIKNNPPNKPTFIEVKTIIGEGLSFASSSNAHGNSINSDDLNSFNKYFDCNFNDWIFPSNVYYHFYKNIIQKGNDKYEKWEKLVKKYELEKPDLLKKFLKEINGEFSDISHLFTNEELPKNKATRSVAGIILEKINAANINDIFILSPDVGKSTNIKINNGLFNNDKNSNMLMTGVREFSMLAIQNGIELHGGIRTISSCFLAFSDYLKSAIRLAAISKINPLIVFTHDSIAVGADGPTHQPIEQIGTLRAIPNNIVFRPCDEQETLAVFINALQQTKDKPTCLVLSRQNLQSQPNSNPKKTIQSGGYIIYEDNNPDIAICASGSEVELAIKCATILKNKFNIQTKVISVPNLNLFLENSDLEKIIFAKYGLVSIEASNDCMWYKLGIKSSNYLNISINQYGYSIDGTINYELLGFNEISVCQKIIQHFYKNEKYNEEITKIYKENLKKFKDYE